jgi:hypothetical protein
VDLRECRSPVLVADGRSLAPSIWPGLTIGADLCQGVVRVLNGGSYIGRRTSSKALERQAPGERAADMRVGEIRAVGKLERALEALPAQRVDPQHAQAVLLVGRRVLKPRHVHAAGRDLAVDALDARPLSGQ